MMLQAYVHTVRMLPIQLDLGQWRQSLMKDVSVPQQNYKNKREETRETETEKDRARETETDREREIYKETKRQ